MAEEPIDLIRLEGQGNSVVLRITGSERRDHPHRPDVLAGEFRIDTPFVRGGLPTRLLAGDLRQWQQALDMLDAGQDIAWRADTRAPGLFIERDEDDDRCQVTIRDDSMSLTTVTVTVPLADTWFDDAYRRLDLALETWPPEED
ncbi:predicted protein [Streptomyces viridochromogenes DSM 40736]|uniref:Predicted protein n=1 Tax=Streptomyces viridochromogenes (strain DSM 40736 / JCM 4977 / BCRC 1201 / Tue 494) TaxID=591159 RepID=D9X3M5_STRVT|nr:DUF5959 family protein [Streptomyces viridochromogenes]EFL31658.1 predicted protein [Streptomyces viridochromogenes DSM 40736]